jgi:prevent-host-death family protein
MFRITGEQLQKTSGLLRAEARRAPVEVTYHGRPELVVLSVDDYARLRQNRKLAFRRETMPAELIERVATGAMSAEHDHLDALMDN